MNWRPSDLVSDTDLLAYEATILTQFGSRSTWRDRLDRATEDWLLPQLEAAGFLPQQLRTRREPTKVLGYTASTYTDKTGAATSFDGTNDLNLATILATVSTDAIYVGLDQPFRGLFVNMLDNVSVTASVLSVAVWEGQWRSVPIADGTSVAGATCAKGGSITWVPPSDWTIRPLSTFGSSYWAKVTATVTPASAQAVQLTCIRSSHLRAPLTLRTLALIFREAPIGQDGPWQQKAEWYQNEADLALTRCLPLIGGEFDTDASEAVSADEDETTTAELTENAGFRLERA